MMMHRQRIEALIANTDAEKLGKAQALAKRKSFFCRDE